MKLCRESRESQFLPTYLAKVIVWYTVMMTNSFTPPFLEKKYCYKMVEGEEWTVFAKNDIIS